jgi:hypothetical protein
MVMFKARFGPLPGKPAAAGRVQQQQQQQQQQHQPQPVPPKPRQEDDPDEAPPIEKERGPQYPVREPGPANPPERVGRETEAV